MAHYFKQFDKNYKTEGFVVLRQFIKAPEFGELHDNVARFIRDVVPSLPREHVFYEDKNDTSTLKQIQQMGVYDPYFRDWMESGPFFELAQDLLNGGVVAKNMQYFNKPPSIGKPTPPHQDGWYFMIEPCAALTMWFALDDVDEENGCVRYLPGSHLEGLRPHQRSTTLGFSQGLVGYPSQDELKREVGPHLRSGDLLVHDALTIHRADGNSSATRNRRALGFIYYSDKAQENKQAHAVYQARLKNELIQSKKI